MTYAVLSCPQIHPHTMTLFLPTAATTWVILFDQQQGMFYMHHPIDRIAHTTAFINQVVEHWVEWEIV